MLILLPLFWVKKQGLEAPVEMLLLIGYMIYNTYEFCSPITRHNYFFVQFIIPLLLLIVFLKRIYLIPIATVAVGLYLNIAVLPSVKMEHSIGQFMICAATIYIVYRTLLIKRLNESRFQINQQLYWI